MQLSCVYVNFNPVYFVKCCICVFIFSMIFSFDSILIYDKTTAFNVQFNLLFYSLMTAMEALLETSCI